MNASRWSAFIDRKPGEVFSGTLYLDPSAARTEQSYRLCAHYEIEPACSLIKSSTCWRFSESLEIEMLTVLSLMTIKIHRHFMNGERTFSSYSRISFYFLDRIFLAISYPNFSTWTF